MAELTQRQRDALALDKNISVTAGAGSGKTKILVDRFLEIVRENPNRVRRILAITFTKKAAAEMLERIVTEINHRLENTKKSQGRHFLLQIRDHISGASVSTIHGFCARILRELPFEAQLSPDFTEIDEMQSIMLKQKAIENTFKWLDECPAEARSKYFKLFTALSVRTVKSMLDRALSSPFEMQSIINRFKNENEDAYITTLENDWLEKAGHITGINELKEIYRRAKAITAVDNIAEKSDNGIKTSTVLKSIAQLEEVNLFSIAGIDAAFSIISRLTKKEDNSAYDGISQLGGKKSWNLHCTQLLVDLSKFCAPLAKKIQQENPGPAPGNADRLWYRLMTVFLEIYENTENNYRAVKEELAVVDFEDLQLATLKLLSGNKDIRQVLSSRYDFIMVDEFQDTNALQWMIIEELCKDQNDKLKKNKIFIVGDPKQSIYGFRNSDVRIFSEVKKQIAALAGFEKEADYSGNIIFEESFRFLPRLNAFINQVFRHVLTNSNDNPYEVDFHPLETKRNLPGTGDVELAVLNDALPEEEYIALSIKNLIDKRLSEETEQPIAYGDIAILLRTRTHLLEVEQALRKYIIPFKTAGGVGFWQRQEIFDFYHLLRFLNNPLDDLALIAVLRSSLFAVPDSALFLLSKKEAKHWLYKLNSDFNDLPLDKNDKDYIFHVRELLKKWLDLRHRIPLEDLLHLIVDDVCLRLVFAGELNGEQLIANMDKLIEQVRNYSASGIGGLDGFIKNINELIREEMREGEANIDLDDQRTVKIMTIHAAKGLQFPVVFVPYLNQSSTRKPFSILLDPDYGMQMKINSTAENSNQKSYISFLIQKRNRMKEIAEARRLLYVAVTRASDRLYLSASLKDKEKPESDSALKFLSSALLSLGIDIKEPGLKKTNDFEINVVHDISFSKIPDTLGDTFNASVNRLTKILEKEVAGAENADLFRIEDTPESQVFSATSIMTFIENPQYYYQRYHLGFFEGDYEAFAEDVYTTDLNMLRGKIVHRFLELLPGSDSENELINQVLFEFEVFENSLREQMTNDLIKYKRQLSGSPAGRSVYNTGEYKNEISITMKIGNHYLTGTLDRIYKNSDQVWEVLDYKTNKISKDDVKKQSRHYLWQIKTYALLLSRLYPEQQQYPVTLYYLYPDILDTYIFDHKDVNNIYSEFADKLKEITGKYNTV
ncbi:MAG: UvrD-helicase domain-containing protein [Calditrichaceae bacterium]|nr:UvrD-helicase domain-containing protein [Calditrichaceae bacterium]MBN2710519.1 UvrD-helicase domain-containing protein [Calditrichaceae bacterium]RQV97311.1 MAG: hypothetical protein EH224_01840 [Calditrichota bacterium]